MILLSVLNPLILCKFASGHSPEIDKCEQIVTAYLNNQTSYGLPQSADLARARVRMRGGEDWGPPDARYAGAEAHDLT